MTVYCRRKENGEFSVPDDLGTRAGPVAALEHLLDGGLRPVVHLAAHSPGDGVLAPVPSQKNHQREVKV